MYLTLPPYRELLNEMTYAIEGNAGVIALMGAGGSGKSAFCNMLVRGLRQMGQQVVYFLHPPHSSRELQDAVCRQLSLPVTTAFEDSLAAWYATHADAHQRLILLIDDAQTMDGRLLSALEVLAGNHLTLVLVGDDSLDGVLHQSQLQRLTPPGSCRFRLLPLTLPQLRLFCREFLVQHDAGSDSIDDSEIKKLLQTTGGLPGAVARQLQATIERAGGSQSGEQRLDLVLPTARRRMASSRHRIRWHIVVSFSVIAIALFSLLLTRDRDGAQPESFALEPAADIVDTAPATSIAVDAGAATAVVPASVPAEPPPEVSLVVEIDQSDIEELLAEWTHAWQQQDLPGYFAAYAAGFVPANGLTRERWQADRSRVIGSARDIRISWRDLVWRSLDNNTVSAELALDYEAVGYRDVTRKRLILQREAVGLRIAEEQNLAVERR